VARLSEAAFADLYRQQARPLWGYVFRVTGNAADADDVVQEAFIRMFNAELPALTPEEMRKYLFRVASNVVTDRWRRSSREATATNTGESAGERGPAVSPDPLRDQDVTRTFAELKPRERALLWLAYVEGEDHRGIADALGLAHGSVKVLLSRARGKLRDLLVARGLGVKTP
jgi:RNA polymerase sigma-70 factor (ECF subfamily)